MCAYQNEKYADFVSENGEGWKDATKKACIDAKMDINAGLNLWQERGRAEDCFASKLFLIWYNK